MSLKIKFSHKEQQTIRWIISIYCRSMRSMGIKTRLSSPLKYLSQPRVKEEDLFECEDSEKMWREIAYICERGLSYNIHQLIEYFNSPGGYSIPQDLKDKLSPFLKFIRKKIFDYSK